jgi:hypothetical protein
MAETPKSGKKDPLLARESQEELNQELNQDHVGAQYRNPNRDRTRGDWDRSQRHHDEQPPRDE